jgi:nucleoside-diphosphate-sugar epimerase
MSRPLPHYRVNVPVNVLEAMLRHGTRTIVFSSSCATYGIPDRLPIPENAPQRSVQGSKLAGQADPLADARFAISIFLLSSFTISWRDRILTSFLSNLRSFLIKKNSYSWPHLQKQIDVPSVSADQDGPALGGH